MTFTNMKGYFEIEEIEGRIDDIHFDCDYVIA